MSLNFMKSISFIIIVSDMLFLAIIEISTLMSYNKNHLKLNDKRKYKSKVLNDNRNSSCSSSKYDINLFKF